MSVAGRISSPRQESEFNHKSVLSLYSKITYTKASGFLAAGHLLASIHGAMGRKLDQGSIKLIHGNNTL